MTQSKIALFFVGLLLGLVLLPVCSRIKASVETHPQPELQISPDNMCCYPKYNDVKHYVEIVLAKIDTSCDIYMLTSEISERSVCSVEANEVFYGPDVEKNKTDVALFFKSCEDAGELASLFSILEDDVRDNESMLERLLRPPEITPDFLFEVPDFKADDATSELTAHKASLALNRKQMEVETLKMKMHFREMFFDELLRVLFALDSDVE